MLTMLIEFIVIHSSAFYAGIAKAAATSSVLRPPPSDVLPGRARTTAVDRRPPPGSRRPILERPAARYGLAVGFVAAAIGATFLIEGLTGSF